MSKCLTRFAVLLLLTIAAILPAAAQYPWPVEPFHETHEITGVFGEYRVGNPEHFHNGTDIPKLDGSPVYAITSSVVTSIDPYGSAAYVRAGNFAYVHVDPSPGLSVDDSVFAQETIVGTVLPGLGHVHLNDGQPGEYRNALRADGLGPYVDTWAPEISSLRFYVQPTRQRLASDELSGPVEITFRVEDPSGPPSTGYSRLNNGAYSVGWQVLSPDRDSVVYSPGPDGVRFRFDGIPSNTYVHNVFDRLQSSNGSHVYIPTNKVARPSSWNTSELPPGPYTLLLFAEDIRGNRGEKYVDVVVTRDDHVPPPQPKLLRAERQSGHAQLYWTSQIVPDLAGYRLYRSDAVGGPWTRIQGEGVLTADSTSYRVPESLAGAQYYYVEAVDTSGNVSGASDTYGVAPASHGKRILIIDGFDRLQASSSWESPRHDFAARHGASVALNDLGFATAANEAVIDDDVNLSEYDAVIWMLGDESTFDETFSTAEQARVTEYLRAGGRLFVNGSEIGWDLGSQGDPGDRSFLHNYLKVAYLEDDSRSYEVSGASGSIFDGISLSYGSSPYEEDYPDVFDPVQGGTEAMLYGNGKVAAVQYSGVFGSGDVEGRVVILGFPFETISTAGAREDVMYSVLQFFFPDVLVASEPPAKPLPRRLTLTGNHPNPSSDGTTITFKLPRAERVTVVIYDVLGRRVAVLGGARLEPGTHEVVWSPENVAVGTYFYRLKAGDEVRTGRMTLAR